MIKITDSKITIKNILVYAHHGVLEQERIVGNEFLVSLELYFDAEAAMKYDDLSLTVNYAQVVQIVRDTMLIPSDLLENVAYRLATSLTEAFPIIKGGTVSVTKVHPPFNTQTEGATFTTSFKS